MKFKFLIIALSLFAKISYCSNDSLKLFAKNFGATYLFKILFFLKERPEDKSAYQRKQILFAFLCLAGNTAISYNSKEPKDIINKILSSSSGFACALLMPTPEELSSYF